MLYLSLSLYLIEVSNFETHQKLEQISFRNMQEHLFLVSYLLAEFSIKSF